MLAELLDLLLQLPDLLVTRDFPRLALRFNFFRLFLGHRVLPHVSVVQMVVLEVGAELADPIHCVLASRHNAPPGAPEMSLERVADDSADRHGFPAPRALVSP